MPSFEKVAPFLDNELVLAGFILFLVVGLIRMVVGLKIFRKLTSELTHVLLMRVITYGFILALCGLIGGFGLAAYRASMQDQPAAGATQAQPITPLVEPKRIESPAADEVAPRALRILEGQSDSSQRRLFDVTVENPLGRQVTLDTWEVQWQYFRGGLAGVAHAAVIQPLTEHAIAFTVDTSDYAAKRQSIPITPDIILPAASRESPSIHKFRLELLYKLASPEMRHPASDWNLVFSISMRTTDGQQIPLFVDQAWR